MAGLFAIGSGVKMESKEMIAADFVEEYNVFTMASGISLL